MDCDTFLYENLATVVQHRIQNGSSFPPLDKTQWLFLKLHNTTVLLAAYNLGYMTASRSMYTEITVFIFLDTINCIKICLCFSI